MLVGRGVLCNRTYDTLNRVELIEYSQGMGAPFFSEDYTYTKASNVRRQRTQAVGLANQVLRYEYDDLYQLTKVEERDGGNFNEIDSFAYDAHGNRTGQGGQSFTNNAADQLTAVGSTSLDYDNSGNADEIQIGSSTPTTYTFNYADLPTKITQGSQEIASYTYDGDRKRVAREVGSQFEIKYLWSGSEILKEYQADGSVLAQYLLGVEREAIKGPDGQWYFYITDRQGSTRQLTNSNGTVVAWYFYDAYGKTISTTGLYNPFQYTGQYYDLEEQHLYLRNRSYHPQYGRFLVRDPIRYQAGTNLYTYCGNNPINRVDPWGLDVVEITGRNRLLFNDALSLIGKATQGSADPFFATLHLNLTRLDNDGLLKIETNYSGRLVMRTSGESTLMSPDLFESVDRNYSIANIAVLLAHEWAHNKRGPGIRVEVPPPGNITPYFVQVEMGRLIREYYQSQGRSPETLDMINYVIRDSVERGLEAGKGHLLPSDFNSRSILMPSRRQR